MRMEKERNFRAGMSVRVTTHAINPPERREKKETQRATAREFNPMAQAQNPDRAMAQDALAKDPRHFTKSERRILRGVVDPLTARLLREDD